MMRTRLIVPDSLRAEDDGFSLAVRLPWYRSLPMSVISLPELTIDDVAIDPARITIEVNATVYAAADLADAVHDWWYVLDPATVRGVGVKLSGEHRVSVNVSFAPPYFDLGMHCAATRGMTVRQDA